MRKLTVLTLAVLLGLGMASTASAQPVPAADTMAPTAPAPKTDTKGDQAAKWIAIMTPLVVGLLGALLAFFNRKNKLDALKSERAQLILSFVKTGVDSFDKYAEKSGAKWDDSLAKLLSDVNGALTAVGQEPLTTGEATRAKQSAEAQKSLVAADPSEDGDGK